MSPLEHDVLELVAQGLDNLSIARRLGSSAKPVRNNPSNILTELAVADRGAAIAQARDAGPGGPGWTAAVAQVLAQVVAQGV